MSIAEKITRLNTAKNDIATAITNKGIEVADTDGLESFAEKIENIPTGGEPEWLGDTWYVNRNFNSIAGSSYIVYNGELYSIGAANNVTERNYWRKFVNGKWSQIGQLPYSFSSGSSVVYNNEIHILGGSYSTKHYKWNGTSWVSVSTLPHEYLNSGAIVYNNEIHILGANHRDYSTKHYKWNGTSWVSVSTLPYQVTLPCVVVYNDEIHLMGTSYNNVYTNHYKWNGTSWVSVSTLPDYMYNDNDAYTNKNYIIFKKYKWDGTAWRYFNGYGGNMCFNGYLIDINSPMKFHLDNYY